MIIARSVVYSLYSSEKELVHQLNIELVIIIIIRSIRKDSRNTKVPITDSLEVLRRVIKYIMVDWVENRTFIKESEQCDTFRIIGVPGI